MANLLEVVGVTIRFGGLVAVKDLSFSVAEGELFGLIGPIILSGWTFIVVAS